MITGAGRSETGHPGQLRAEFARQHPGTGMLNSADGLIHRIYGRAFARWRVTDRIPQQTFIQRWSSLYGVPDAADQLVSGGLDSGRVHLQPIYYFPES